jgi:hypothetical protein
MPVITVFAVRFVINFGFAGSEIFTAVPLKNRVFWEITLPCWFSGSHHFGEQMYSKRRQPCAKRHIIATQM